MTHAINILLPTRKTIGPWNVCWICYVTIEFTFFIKTNNKVLKYMWCIQVDVFKEHWFWGFLWVLFLVEKGEIFMRIKIKLAGDMAPDQILFENHIPEILLLHRPCCVGDLNISGYKGPCSFTLVHNRGL